MSIKINRYVNITSGVAGAAAVPTRALIARLFTDNNLLPPGTFKEFSSADAVGLYFGTSSQEYLRALFYFGFTSKNIVKPRLISYGRWVDADVAPMVFGAPGPQSIVTWNAISSGSFILDIGGVSNTLTAMDFSGAANLAAVAAIIQTKIRTLTGTMYTLATVSYDATRGSFDFVGGVVGPATISIAAGAGGSDIAGQLGWISAATILAPGATTQTITDALTQSAGLSDNFGSFAFMATVTNNQIVLAAQWNLALNVKFMYSVAVSASGAAALQALLANIGGVAITLASPGAAASTEYPEMAPMMILAATNYSAVNATQNYEFYEFDLTPSVLTDADADTYDAISVNYYGQTQTAGVLRSFYQQGVMQGLDVDPLDMNTYANEMWLKAAAASGLLSLLLVLAKVSANAVGRSQIISTMNPIIDLAVENGTISVGKPFDSDQIAAITQFTNDPLAWRQVQNIGYWFDVVITPYTVGSTTKYKAVYTLVYSKDDVIRLVEGTDILI